MQRVSMLQIRRDVDRLQREMVIVKKRLRSIAKEPVIIERVPYSSLTAKERRHIRQAREDIRHGRLGKFVTLEQVMARYGIKL